MSRFKNEITHLQAHIKTLRLGLAPWSSSPWSWAAAGGALRAI